ALLAVAGHAVQGILQGQARFAQLFLLHGLLLNQLGLLLLQALTAQQELFVACLQGRQARLQISQQACLFSQLPALLVTLLLQPVLLLAQLLQPGILLVEALFGLRTGVLQVRNLLATCQQAAVTGSSTSHPQEVPSHPVAIAADQALPGCQTGARRQGLFQAVQDRKSVV